MIKELNITNIGPASSMAMTFAHRLNIFTGDNGLGKSFILDVIWYVLTRTWPSEINNNLVGDFEAKPADRKKSAEIAFTLEGNGQEESSYISTFDSKKQKWSDKAGRPINSGLVIYALPDGSFAVWDPARNNWKIKDNGEDSDHTPAYVFSTKEIWDGLKRQDQHICNGLIADWASWYKSKDNQDNIYNEYQALCSSLSALSHQEQELKPGGLTRLWNDSRDIPTLKTFYGDVPVTQTSSGIKRILGLAYILTWAWKEHRIACDITGASVARQITFLFDEVEAHLHPKWQRTIIPSLLGVLEQLSDQTSVQLILTTHSPLVLASLENQFQEERDSWFDIDASGNNVILQKREFIKHGDASSWLTSDAFDLKTATSLELESLFAELNSIYEYGNFTEDAAKNFEAKLRETVPSENPLWIRWEFFKDKKGWVF